MHPINSGQHAAQRVTKLNKWVNPPLLPIRFNAVRWVIEQYPEHLEGAVAAVKQGLQAGWITNPTGYFIKALKEGIKPEPIRESVGVMGRTHWWKWIGQQWGESKRNSLIQRVSDLGQGLRVYFVNGLEYPFEVIQQMELAEIEKLATQR